MKRGLRKNRENFAESKTKRARVLWLLTLLLFAVFLGSFALGRYGVSACDVVRILAYRAAALVEHGPGAPLHALQFSETPMDGAEETAASTSACAHPACMLVGGLLPFGGGSFVSGWMENHGSPDVLGASSGAAFGAACILLGASKRRYSGRLCGSLCAWGSCSSSRSARRGTGREPDLAAS